MSIDLRTVGSHSKTTSPKRSSAGSTVKPLENLHAGKAESDAVRFTDAGAILQNAERLVAALPVVDTSLVSAISESLDNGSYIVDAKRVAEKIIELEQQLPA